jgi:tRNA pseudouridine38-40 synthase
MRNIRLVLAYDGTDFCGWQRQPNIPTVQACLEEAIVKIVGGNARVWGSGRTDAGVHALNQIANFRTACSIPCVNLVRALNDHLPATVRIKDARDVAEKFHARYDVRAKTYRYRILRAPICSPFLWRFVYHYPYPLDRARMRAAAEVFEGEHDFTSFAASEKHLDGAEGPKSMVRRVFRSRFLWRQRTSLLIYEIRGNGFLHHMVRNIVGTLMEVGRGRLTKQDVTRILEARDRTLAGPTAPAQGLCLVKVEY